MGEGLGMQMYRGKTTIFIREIIVIFSVVIITITITKKCSLAMKKQYH